MCPGVDGAICAPCCGTARENTIDCPSVCEYLIEARRHEEPRETDPRDFPHPEIELTGKLIEDNSDLLLAAARTLIRLSLPDRLLDRDVREALEALIRARIASAGGGACQTHQESASALPVAAEIEEAIAACLTREGDAAGFAQSREREVLGILVFLQRLEIDRSNGRPRGRAFIDFLRGQFGVEDAAPAAP
jgi:hypothetical protein